MGVVIPADEDEEEQRLLDPDSDMLQQIVLGVSMRRDDLDR